MADVFISYARSTARIAKAASDALSGEGFSAWMDEELPAHRAYADVISERLDEAKAVLDRFLPETVVAGTHDWDVARLHEPYGDGSYHGKLLKRVRKQLRSVSSREALVTPFLLRREWGR